MTKGVPKMDGSGKGNRSNRGRGGCSKTKPIGQGRNSRGLRNRIPLSNTEFIKGF